MNIKQILISTTIFIASSFCILFGMNNQLEMAPQNPTCSYKWCAQAYDEWPCEQRCQCTQPFLATCCTFLTSRECATIGISLKKNNHCGEIHSLAWCTQNAWCPCLCDSPENICCSITNNALTGITVSSILTVCCILSPWMNSKGCRLNKKNTTVGTINDDSALL